MTTATTSRPAGATEVEDAPAPEAVAETATEADASATAEAGSADQSTEATAPEADGETIGASGDGEAFAVQDDPAAVEAAMAAIEAAYTPPRAKAKPPAAEAESAESTDADDPRLAALGLSPDLGAAEAEAAAVGRRHERRREIQTIDDDALAARLAGLVPEGGLRRRRAPPHRRPLRPARSW